MERRLNDRQKKLVIAKLRALKSKPTLLAKYDRDGDGVISDEDWEAARRDVIRQVLREDSSRVFEVAPIMSGRTRQSPLLVWMSGHRDLVGLVCVIAGGLMILTDPGTFAPRGAPPYELGEGGVYEHMKLLQFWLNWSSSGWAGLVLILFGLSWDRLSHYMID
ncbi:MAG: hypothetical protein ACNS63_11730 [Candidatus Nitrospinota bacterium M3_3B_026]